MSVFETGKTYVVSFKYRSADSGGTIHVYQATSVYVKEALPDNTGDAILFSTNFTATADALLTFYIAGSADGDAYIEIDEVSVVEYQGNTGTLI